MASFTVSFEGELWEYEGQGAWHFVSLPVDDADDIRAKFSDRGRGFGSLKVEATIGSTRWSTSIFPDTKHGTYLLPVKKSVRVAEGLGDGSRPRVQLVLVDA